MKVTLKSLLPLITFTSFLIIYPLTLVAQSSEQSKMCIDIFRTTTTGEPVRGVAKMYGYFHVPKRHTFEFKNLTDSKHESVPSSPLGIELMEIFVESPGYPRLTCMSQDISLSGKKNPRVTINLHVNQNSLGFPRSCTKEVTIVDNGCP